MAASTPHAHAHAAGHAAHIPIDQLFTLGSPGASSGGGMDTAPAIDADPFEDMKPVHPHHPQLESYQPAFGLPGVPGGDCKRLCVRHQRMVDGGARQRLQQSIENLSPADQSAVNSIWSLFSSSRGAQRILILRGILSICCPSQLSFLSEQIQAECRIDPFSLLPREVSIRCLAYLDAISLGRAAQVSRAWRDLADDDSLWRTMCQQHIERKCEKCGWGLPLLEKKRRARAAVAKQRPQEPQSPGLSPALDRISMIVDNELASPQKLGKRGRTRDRTRDAESWTSMDLDSPPAVRSRPSSRAANSRPVTPPPPMTKPWKAVYTERLVVERNWRKGTCNMKTFEGHTDAITCLQFDETLSSPSFPVLMTGSWDRTVRVWNMETGACVNVLRGHQRGVRALQFDSSKLITGSMDATLKIWSWRTGECVRTLQGHRDSVICLAYDRHLLASGSADSTIKLWDFSTGECVTFRGHREWVNSLQIWSPDECEDSAGPDLALSQPSGSAAASPTSDQMPRIKLLFSGSDDGTIRVWDLYTRQCVRVLQGHVAQVQSLRVISVPGVVPVMPTALLGKALPSTSKGEGGSDYFGSAATSSMAADDDRSSEASDELVPLDFGVSQQPMVISASLDNTIKIWNTEQGRCERTLFGHVEGVWAVDMDKLRLVSGSHDRTIKVWDRSTGRSDDKIVTGGDDGSCRIWCFGAVLYECLMTNETRFPSKTVDFISNHDPTFSLHGQRRRSIVLRMSAVQNLQSKDPFAADLDDEFDDKEQASFANAKKESSNVTHIRIQQRNGRKTLTTIQGLPAEYDPKKVLKAAKKEFACNGSMVEDPDYGQVIQLQGDQRTKIQELLIGEGIDKAKIKVHGF